MSTRAGLGALCAAVLLVGGCERNDSREGQPSAAVTRQSLVTLPDFVVTAVKGPASATPGQAFTAQVTVCNQGTQGDSADVELYLSADATIRTPVPPNPPEDMPLGMVPVQWLAPGQCTTQSLNVYANVPPPGGEGPYWLGAVVDPRNYRSEVNEANNALAGTRMGVGLRPDFIVTSVTGPASVRSGQSFTAQVTVCNQGTQASSADVELYLSADATIRPPVAPNPPEDMPLGMLPVSWLEPGQCNTQSLNVSANVPPPGGEGPYWLGAVVDPRSSRFELNEDNNALAGTRMGVGSRSDFVVTSVTGPNSAQFVQSFTARVTVCNQGTQGDSADVELYLSADATIRPPVAPNPPEDMPLGIAYVPWLEPGQCTTQSLNVYANVPPPGGEGPYWLGAVVDPRSSRFELIEDNNALAGMRMGVGSRADFVVTSVTGPVSATPGQAFTAQVTVCNQGTQGDSADVELYLSADATIRPPVAPIPPEDTPLGMLPVPWLAPGQCTTQSLSVSANVPPPGDEGPYWLGAVVDPRGYRPELIEDNNALAGMRIGVGLRPDFIVTSVTGPVSATLGQSFTAQVTVCNQGTQASSADVELYLSADATIRPPVAPSPPEDMPLGMLPTLLLAPGQCATQSLNVSANVPPPGGEGAYWLGAIVDPRGYKPELIEDNNALAGMRMGVGSRADFVVTSVTGPNSAQFGQSFTARVTVCNQGTRGDSADVELYLSADTTIRPPVAPNPPEDSPLGFAYVPWLEPGQCNTQSLNVYANVPPPGGEGPYWLGAVVDPRSSRFELNEDNNALAGTRMGVGSRSDFVITSVTGPNSAQLGQSISVSVTVCNRGTLADSTDVELYLSADTTISRPLPPAPLEDAYLASVTSGVLNPGACVSRSATVTASAPSQGAWYLGAIADALNSRPELIEDNNAFVGNRIGLGSGADFVINSVSVPTNAVRPGQSFSTSVSVCNRGTAAGSTDVALYLSPDTTIAVPTASSPSEDFQVGNLVTATLNPGTCASYSATVAATVPREGTWYLGAIADPTNSRPELIEDNNARASSRLGVGNLADFTFTALSGPTTATRGQAYTASFTVCNRGTVADSVDVELYFSADTTISPPVPGQPLEDSPQGMVPVGTLGAGACTTRSFTFNVSVPSAGSWYLGIAADPFRARPELFEDNNTRSGTLVSIAP